MEPDPGDFDEEMITAMAEAVGRNEQQVEYEQPVESISHRLNI